MGKKPHTNGVNRARCPTGPAHATQHCPTGRLTGRPTGRAHARHFNHCTLPNRMTPRRGPTGRGGADALGEQNGYENNSCRSSSFVTIPRATPPLVPSPRPPPTGVLIQCPLSSCPTGPACTSLRCVAMKCQAARRAWP